MYSLIIIISGVTGAVYSLAQNIYHWNCCYGILTLSLGALMLATACMLFSSSILGVVYWCGSNHWLEYCYSHIWIAILMGIASISLFFTYYKWRDKKEKHLII